MQFRYALVKVEIFDLYVEEKGGLSKRMHKDKQVNKYTHGNNNVYLLTKSLY
jgi:hypothetical protein